MITRHARAVVVAAIVAGCSGPPVDALELNGNMLTVSNTTSSDWSGIEIWLNTYYRVTTPSIPAHGRFQAPLDTFVAGFGQRFDFHRMQVKDVRLTAKLPDGKPMEIKKELMQGGLAGALGKKP